MVTKAERCYSQPFKTGIGVTQGDFLSPILFNIVVYAVLRVVLIGVYSSQEA